MSRHYQARRGQAAPITSTSSLPPHVSPAVKAGTQSGGQALDRHTSAEMSAKFGHSFSQVRIHTDSRAGDAASAMGANAFALGPDIVFGAGKYQPGSLETDRLLAHELTHVVQQDRWGMGDWGRTSREGDASEREADGLAAQVMRGQSVQVQAAPGAAIARDDDPLGGPPAPKDGYDDFWNTAPAATPAPASTTDAPTPAPPATPAPASPWNSVADNPITNSTPYKVATDNSSGLLTVPQAIADVSDAKSLSNGLNTFGKVMAPVGVASNALSLAQDVHNDHPVDAAADAAGLGSSAITLAQMGGLVATGGAVAGAGAVAGVGAGAYAAGNLLANKTEVGPDTANTVGAIDHSLTAPPGQTSFLGGLDDFRKDSWQKGNYVTSAGAGVAEGAVGLAGAVGGLAEGAWHGMEWLGKNI